MIDNRRLLTWTLMAGGTDYQKDIDKYGHKIYAIGIHEFSVKGDGTINDRRMGGNALTNYFPKSIEDDMLRWTHIHWYLSMTAFGADDVLNLLDNTIAQDTLISNLNSVVARYQTERYGSAALPVYGIEIDFEATLSDYPDRQGDDVKYINVLKRIKNEVCIPNGLKMQVNTYGMWGANTPYYYRFHNYALFAEATDNTGAAAIDSLQCMTYDFSWSGSAPGASTPIWWFKQVTEWAKQNFDPSVNPSAKLTIDNVFFGCAGYGNRWGIFDASDLNGRNVTYRNLLGWQNGLYRHYHYDGAYTYHDQEYLLQNGFEDKLSKNQTMFQHVYDFGSAKYAAIKKQDGAPTAYPGTYNEKDYITSYSRTQQAEFTGVHEVKTGADDLQGKFSTSYTVSKSVGASSYLFQGYTTQSPEFIPALDQETGLPICTLEETPQAIITYDVSPGAGMHRLIALVSFPWYTSKTIGGTVNGQSFTIGGSNIPEYYPLMFKDSHWYDMGEFSFESGINQIKIDGSLSDSGAVIFGFMVCDSFKHNFIGGELEFPVNVQPFKKKDGTDATIPQNLVISTEILRQNARPVILWEDLFAQYLNDTAVQSYGLTDASTYYKRYGNYTGNGDTYDDVTLTCKGTYQDGYSYGEWKVIEDENCRACARFDYTQGTSTGQLMLNHTYRGNIQVEAEFRLEEGNAAGIRFGSLAPGDGYVFQIDYAAQVVRLVLENGSTTTIAEEPLSETWIRGNTTKLKVILHNGKGYFYLGYSEKQVFGGALSLTRSAGGACGVHAWDTKTNVYKLSISSTDKWELMEKFEVEIDGTVYPFGQIDRPGYTYDEWGFLNYAGINELNTRTDPTSVAKDYKFNIATIPGFQGAKTIKLRLLDPGLWWANVYVGDAEGCSITYAGDAETFLNLMNIATNDYGAKGIGLWTMGQEDPKLFEMVPDVVPWHE